MPSLQTMLADPPAKFRPVPFWSWNADLRADELVRQVHLMKDAGLGGFFMHARGGLETEYMGDEWFAVTEAVLDAAAETGMNAWAYDENGWPSGFGDGKVNGLGEAYQLKYFRCEKTAAADLGKFERVLAVFSPDGRRVAPENASGEVLVLRYEINPFYVDNADPLVVKKFLEVIYQAYLDRLPAAKVRHLAGFFTDEPQLSRNGIPYSPALMKAYREAWGEELLDRVPELFFRLGEWRRTRVRFWRTVARCFASAYSAQIGAWCRAHGLKLTGHMVCEETFESQTPSNGAVMPHYSHFDIPGMDFLGRELHPFTLPLQVWSACAQTGRKQMLTETYAGCGWNVSFDDLRFLLNDQMVRGANLLCPHLESYTLRGIRKRDYPASLFFHQPWWPWYRRFADYASRVGMLLASGDDPADILLIHSLASGHMHYDPIQPGVRRGGPDDLCVRYWEKLIELATEMEARQCAFHLGDETIMTEKARVTADGLRVGLATYRAVVLPETATLSADQVRLLDAFADAGFPVFAVRDTLHDARYVDGVPTGWGELEKKIRWSDSAAAAAEAAAATDDRFSLRTPDGQLCRRLAHTSRLVPDWDGEAAEIHFITNADRERGYDTVIRMRGNSCAVIDPYTGTVEPVAFRAADGTVELERTIPAGGELLVAASARTAASPAIAAGPARRAVELPAEMTVRSATENLLTLDRCDCYADGKLFLADEYVLTIQNKLLELRRDLPVRLVFRFRTTADFRPGRLELLVERPACQKIRVNGTVVPSVGRGYFQDPAFERVDIAFAVRPGENVIELERDFTQSEKTRKGYEAAWIFESERNKLAFDTELEAIYLAGDFAVDTSAGKFVELPGDLVRYSGEFALADPVKTVRTGAVEQSGFPFFAGIMELEGAFAAKADGEPVKLAFARRRATVCEVSVNGRAIGTLCWHEDGIAVPEDLVKRGANTVTLKLATSLRNMLGQHHLDCGEIPTCGGPGTFYQDRGVFSQRGVEPWNRDWCFARTGMAVK